MRYSIEGEPFPVVICELDPGEEMITESGAMAWMNSNMNMATQGGGIGKMFGRMMSGESIFLNRYTASGGPGMISFASSFPGSIRAYEIGPGKEIIAQKRAFLAATSGVELSVAFQKKVGSGFFGGEGFIMQRISGSGMAFLEFDGYVKEYVLQAGEQMIIDTGHLALMDATCSVDVETVKGIKNIFLGGESIFNTVVTGPGRVTLQTMPLSAFAQNLIPYLPKPVNVNTSSK